MEIHIAKGVEDEAIEISSSESVSDNDEASAPIHIHVGQDKNAVLGKEVEMWMISAAPMETN